MTNYQMIENTVDSHEQNDGDLEEDKVNDTDICMMDIMNINIKRHFDDYNVPLKQTSNLSQEETRMWLGHTKAYNLVSSVTPNQNGPFEQKIEITGGYTFWRGDYIGRHIIDIKRPEVDRFYMTVGVKHEGNFWDRGNGVKRIGYSLIGTNGSYNDVKEAIDATGHLW